MKTEIQKVIFTAFNNITGLREEFECAHIPELQPRKEDAAESFLWYAKHWSRSQLHNAKIEIQKRNSGIQWSIRKPSQYDIETGYPPVMQARYKNYVWCMLLDEHGMQNLRQEIEQAKHMIKKAIQQGVL